MLQADLTTIQRALDNYKAHGNYAQIVTGITTTSTTDPTPTPQGRRMNARDFCFWLQGFFEINGEAKEITVAQAKMISDHLNYVFHHDIVPGTLAVTPPPTPNPTPLPPSIAPIQPWPGWPNGTYTPWWEVPNGIPNVAPNTWTC